MTPRVNYPPQKNLHVLTRALVVAGFLLCIASSWAQFLPPGGGKFSLPDPLNTWSFTDTNNWTSDADYAPVSFTNITSMQFGDGTSLSLDTNVLAWLQYNVFENDGTTNLTVDTGSLTFWFSPDWAGTNDSTGGSGPQNWGRLIEVGGFTSDSSYGWWSLYTDPAGVNIYFSAQTNDSSGNLYTISMPVNFTTNYWHFIALTYSSTNVSLYLDGQLATNDPTGLSVWPGADVLAGGFYVGSDSNGIYQAQGEFDDISTYNVVLDSNQVQRAYSYSQFNYFLNPWNWEYMQAAIVSAPSNPSSSQSYYNAITGQGSLQQVGSTTAINSTNIWITNVVATSSTSLKFTIQGGSNNVPYDVFANSVLSFGTNGVPWAWMGQGYHGNTYTLSNLPPTACFLILGFPTDTDGDGLTDAYENLVSKTRPDVPDTDGDGLSDSWEVLLGLNALVNDNAQSASRSNYSYDFADWLNGISGIRTGSVSLDNEGNVLSVSQ
jgi:hypothetical protein